MARKRGYRVKSDRVRVLRDALFLSQEELAAKAGVSEATIRRMERAGEERAPHRTTVRAVAAALGVDWTEIIEIMGPEPGRFMAPALAMSA